MEQINQQAQNYFQFPVIVKNPVYMNCHGEQQYNELLKIVGAENTKAVQIGGASGTCLPKITVRQATCI